VNSPGFSVQLTAELALWTVVNALGLPTAVNCDSCSGDGTAYIDSIYVTVYYRPAATTHVVPLDWSLGVAGTGTSFQLAPTGDLANPVLSVQQNGDVNVKQGDVLVENGKVAIGTTDPLYFKLNVNGDAGKPGGGMWSTLSDSRMKRDIEPMADTLDRLLSLHGYTYEYTAEAVHDRLALPGRQMGLLAEEVEQVFPDWVNKDDEGYRYLTERSTTALMVEALRDLRAEKDCAIAELQAKNDALQKKDEALQEENDALQKQNAELEARVAAVEAAVARLAAQAGRGRP
jgi:hypothetical protein